MLGVLAIISGSKIATALLILGLPIMDLAGVMIARRFFRGKNPFRTADRSHLHFRLQDAGLSPRQTVLLIWGITAVFGLATLLFNRAIKVGVLMSLVLVVIGLLVWTARRTKSFKS
jgi:UDP-GlcNAc:undecaprenyl-phosphate GlcNAc-1-phosphate transferase